MPLRPSIMLNLAMPQKNQQVTHLKQLLALFPKEALLDQLLMKISVSALVFLQAEMVLSEEFDEPLTLYYKHGNLCCVLLNF